MIVTASERNCQRKIRHHSEAKALRAASRVAGKARVRHLRVYRCPHCQGWHLTRKVQGRG